MLPEGSRILPAWIRMGAALGLLVLGVTGCAASGATARGESAAPSSTSGEPIAARVVWWQGGRVYLAALDSTFVATGTRLTLLDGTKKIAEAEVSDQFDREIVAARLTWGSLDRVKRPERLRVRAERSAPASGRAIRIGYARAPRSTPLWSCEGVERSGSLRDRYRLADSTASGLVLVRRGGVSGTGAPWPDTVTVRLFDDEADVEIALERGDLDAGVFWPGEASTHIRDAMRWNGSPAGVRSRGVVTIGAGGDSAAIASMARSPKLRASLAALNREYFRGDLLPIALPPPAGDASTPTIDPRGYVVRGPYSGPLERFLNHGMASGPPRPGPGVVSIQYLDEPPDSIGTPGELAAFALRCPIITASGDRAAIEAIGADELVNLFRCAGGSGR